MDAFKPINIPIPHLNQISVPDMITPHDEALVIIGNGYDLARGYPTSYGDFFKYLDGSFGQQFDDFDVSPTNRTNLNFWYYYLKKLSLSTRNWSDVEYQIKSALLYVNSHLCSLVERGTTESNFNDNNFDFNETFALALINYLPHVKSDENVIFDFLFKELKGFEQLFKKYILLITHPENINQSEDQKAFEMKSVGVLIGNNDDIDISILNFNYTNFPDTELSYTNQHCWNIHGSAAHSDLIFGIDSTNISPDSPMYKFTKTSKLMFANLNTSTTDILSPGIENIIFVGHSLNEADYSYFQSIFDYLSIYDTPVTLRFVYTAFHETNPKMMESYQLSIHRLLSKYGNTLDNVSHGDNLIAKLLLENRLKMFRI